MYLTARSRASSFIYQKAQENQGTWLIPDNICHAVYVSIRSAGSNPKLVDINENTWELDTNQVLDLLRSNEVAGIIMVRAFGSNEVNYDEFFDLIKASYPKVYIIDDRCLCFPEFEVKNTSADMLLYSTGYSKVVDLGFGGYSFSKNKMAPIEAKFSSTDAMQFDSFFKRSIESESALTEQQLNEICNMSWLDHESFTTTTYIESIKNKFDLVKTRKKKLNSIYNNIRPELTLNKQLNNWRYNLMLRNRNEVMAKIFEAKLFASSHYHPLGLFLDSQYQSTWVRFHKGILNLFNDMRVEEEDVERIVKIVNNYGKPFR